MQVSCTEGCFKYLIVCVLFTVKVCENLYLNMVKMTSLSDNCNEKNLILHYFVDCWWYVIYRYSLFDI